MVKLYVGRMIKVLGLSNQKTYPPKNQGNNIKELLSTVFSVLMLGAIGYYGYSELSKHFGSHEREPLPVVSQNNTQVGQPKVTNQNFTCDGRQHCNQMTSKDEAQYFLAHCPDVKMDGDGDGDACEQQFRH